MRVDLESDAVSYTQPECGGGSFHGTMTGQWLLSGSAGGNQVGVQVGPSTRPSFTTGSVGEEGSQPGFGAEGYPAVLGGGAQNTHHLETQFGEVECESLEIGGTISGASTALGVQPGYGDCTVLGFPAEVAMNGCKYEFGVSASGPYSGTLDLACSGGAEWNSAR